MRGVRRAHLPRLSTMPISFSFSISAAAVDAAPSPPRTVYVISFPISYPTYLSSMSEENPQDSVEQVTQEVKAVKLENGAAPGATNGTKPEDNAVSFKDAFKAFSKFGDPKSDGKHITLSQSDKWMKQAKVIDGKKVTTTDTAIHFKKLKTMKLTEADYLKFLDDLAKSKKVELDEIKKKLTTCGQPGLTSHVTKSPAAAAAVDRLTDTSKYTGSHRNRFDETGKGKGIAGRKDLVDGSGYVSGYQHKDSYDKSH